MAPELAGKDVAWFVYCGNDLHETLMPSMGQYRMPFLREKGDDWEIATEHISDEPWPFKSSSNYHAWLAEMSCNTVASRRIFSAVDYLIKQASEVCGRVDARLTVISIPMRVQLSGRGRAKLRSLAPDPASFEVSRPDARLAESCGSAGVRFISLRGALAPRHYLLRDIHWSRPGHRRVGRLLSELFETNDRASPGDKVGAGARER